MLLTILLLAQWAPTATPNKASLRGLSAVDGQTAWASGANATVLRTLDGGTSWTTLAVPSAEGLDFRDVHAFSARIAVLMSAGPGDKSRIYRTVDGGAHWTLTHQNQHPQGFFDGIAFWDKQRGLLIGDPVDGRFTILRTNDGGQAWTPIAPAGMPPANAGEGAFAASGTSLALGKNGEAWFGTGGALGGRIFHSRDWGVTWTVTQTPIRHDSASAGIFSVVFARDGKHGFATGGDYQKFADPTGSLIATTDGGQTWTLVSGLSGYRSAIALEKSTIFATGPDGSDISLDFGKTWHPAGKPGFHALSIAGGQVWASGSEGRISRRSAKVDVSTLK